jgi:hypothetical protein|tara:strand:+ start:1370 stop:1825 length:456 start_codon:yes stop_codon:yes gene_type:complete
MNYQSVRTAIETPFQTNYGALSPAIPIFFDNFYNVLADSVDEFINVNIQFGLTTETALTSSHNHIRGIIVVRVCTEKNKGPARNQTLATTAFTTLNTLDNTAKSTSGVYLRMGQIDGPSFTTVEGGQESRKGLYPFFMSRIETNFQAQLTP